MTLSLRILQIDVPASELVPVTAFWTQALSATPVDAPGAFVHLADAASVLEVHIQALDDGDPRYHLDLEVAPGSGRHGVLPPTGHSLLSAELITDEVNDRDAEVARLTQLGATDPRRFDSGYTVLTDPAGLPLCVIDVDAAVPTPVRPGGGGFGTLTGVFIDVPEALAATELQFWSQALHVQPQPTERPDVYTALMGVIGPGGPVLFEVQRTGEGTAPRYHIDISAADVEAEAMRLEMVGASRIDEVEDWIILADPVGNLLCVVPASS